MKRLSTLALAALLLSAGPAPSLRAGDLLPPHVAAQLGMTEAWKRYVPVPAGAQSIIDQQLFVHQANPREYVEVTLGKAPEGEAATGEGAEAAGSAPKAADTATGAAETNSGQVMLRIPTDRKGLDGQPIGKQEAERLAMHQVRQLKRRGHDAYLSWRTVPRVHLYTLARDGMVECRDAETGESLWMSRCGDRGLHYGAMGISEEYLSVVNGPNLIQLDINNGEVIEELATMGAPLLGAIHSGQYIIVPTIRNGVEGYLQKDPTFDPFMESVQGIALALPTKAKSKETNRVAWGTSKGYVYVMELAGEPSVLFRLNTDGIVSGRIAAASGDRFFFGSEGGQVYGLRATFTGKVMWVQPFGEPFYNEPMVHEDKVFIRSTYGNLFSLGTDDGISRWDRPVPNVDELVGVIGDHLFVKMLSGSLSVLDVETGNRVRSYPNQQVGRLLVNNVTDRLYVVNDAGAVQCLRPEGADLPTLREEADFEPAADETPADTAAPPATSPFGPGNTDPFGAGGGVDPFGGAAPAGNDPFGGGADNDPFGGGAEMDDPFGGNDPFGGM